MPKADCEKAKHERFGKSAPCYFREAKRQKDFACGSRPSGFPAAPFQLQRRFNMSQHNSFKATASAGSAKRSVLKRFERLDLLKKRGTWKGTRLSGLPKTKPEV
jgi:small basic protein (TIGR04137 family)